MDTVLIFAPHTDDGEIGCGGSIAKFVEEGRELYYVAFSVARTSAVQNGFPENILEIEVKKAMQVLGIPEDNLILYDFPVRKFPEVRQNILEEMIKLRRRLDRRSGIESCSNGFFEFEQLELSIVIVSIVEFSIVFITFDDRCVIIFDDPRNRF